MEKLRALLLPLALLSSLPVGAQNWPSFRGPDAAGVAEGPGPTTWDLKGSVHVRWKTEIPGLGHSSPVIWGDRVFVTTAISSGPPTELPVALNGNPESSPDMAAHSWRVYCLDKQTGKVLWEKVLHEGVPRSKRHPRNSFATPTPVTDGRYLVVSFGSDGLFGLDLDGKLLWRQDLGDLSAGSQDAAYQWGFASSPVLHGNLVLIQADVATDPFLAAYEVTTGKLVWKIARADRQSWSTPGLTRGLAQDELVTIAPRAVRGYDPQTGRELWHLNWNIEITESTPLFRGGILYLSSGKGPKQPILALRPGARGDITPQPGKPLDPHIVWLSERGGPITTSPLVYGDCLYALVDVGILRCFSLTTGEEVFAQRLPSQFMGSPVAADGKLYLTSLDGDIFVLRAGTRFEQLAVNALDGVSYATPAISDGLLVVRTQHFLYGIAEPAAPASAGAATAKPANRFGAHVGIVVRDIEKAARAAADLFGLQVPRIVMNQPPEISHMQFHGEPSEGRAKLAFLKVNDIVIELIEPVGGPSTWRDFLDQKGEGVHHIAFTAEGEEDVARLEEKGAKLVQKGNFPGGGGYSYLDLTQQLGVIVELLKFPEER